MVKFYCESCGCSQPVIIEEMKSDDLNGDNIWGDIVCGVCHGIVATATVDKPGKYEFVLKKEGDDMIEPETEDGYPTEETLEAIESWGDLSWGGQLSLINFVRKAWYYPDRIEERKNNKYWFSTGGWSGNEDLIDALRSNHMFWMLCWYSSKRGGYYVFKLKKVNSGN